MIRQLYRMRTEIDWWEATYAQYAMEPDRYSPRPQYLRRSELLQVVQADLGTAMAHLEGLPRLS